MNTNESGTTMTERRRYYALTDDDVETLIRAAETWAHTLQMNNRPAKAELRAVSNLTPLDEDDAVTEDMVDRAAQQLWAEMDTWASAAWCNEWARQPEHTRNAYRSHARAVLDAALGAGEGTTGYTLRTIH